MMAQRNITDRAHRYRANKIMPGGRKACAWCGSTSNVVPDHIDGHPDHTERSNLQWLCKSCNTKKGAAFAKLGKGRLTHQYNPKGSAVPTFQQYAWAVANHSRGAHDEAGVIIHATPKSKRVEYAKRIAGVKRERGTDSSLPDWARNPAGKFELSLNYYGSGWRGAGTFTEKKWAEREGREQQKQYPTLIKGWKVKAVKSNPAAQSAEVFEDFHGDPPTETVTVTKKVHHHAHLAALGRLVSLDVWGVDGKGHKITGFKKALLCSNEDRNQLFIEGGDQRVSLADFGIKHEHEMETLGQVTEIAYHTKKSHLGSEGGEAVYVHRFRSTNENGKHVMVKMTREPDLVYDVPNEQLLFSGGSYEILREGIDK